MTAIAIGFCKPQAEFVPVSWIIQRSEGVNFSHTYIKIYSASLKRMLIYQATGSGVYFIGLDAFNEHYQVVEEYQLNISDAAKVRLLQWCVDNSGKPYGRLQCLGIGIQRLFKLIGIKINNPFPNGDQAYICTELVAKALEELGIKFDQPLDEVDLLAIKQAVIKAIQIA